MTKTSAKRLLLASAISGALAGTAIAAPAPNLSGDQPVKMEDSKPPMTEAQKKAEADKKAAAAKKAATDKKAKDKAACGGKDGCGSKK